jgi:amidophosphoribosyltransferase
MAGRVVPNAPHNPLAALYARFTDEEHCAEIARLLTPPGIKAEVVVVYQTVENLRKALSPAPQIGDWYFTGDYPTPGGYKVLHKAISNYLDRNTGRSY